MSDIEQNKALYRRFIQEIFNEGRLERVGEFTAPNYRVRDLPPGTPDGVETLKQIVSLFRAGFPDLSVTLDEVIGEGDTVAARATTRGTHKGKIFNVEPSGNKIAVSGLTMVKIENGKLVESCVKNDMQALMAQLNAK